jgi:hypothetical protein
MTTCSLDQLQLYEAKWGMQRDGRSFLVIYCLTKLKAKSSSLRKGCWTNASSHEDNTQMHTPFHMKIMHKCIPHLLIGLFFNILRLCSLPTERILVLCIVLRVNSVRFPERQTTLIWHYLLKYKKNLSDSANMECLTRLVALALYNKVISIYRPVLN